jgi:hypothetical protein
MMIYTHGLNRWTTCKRNRPAWADLMRLPMLELPVLAILRTPLTLRSLPIHTARLVSDIGRPKRQTRQVGLLVVELNRFAVEVRGSSM